MSKNMGILDRILRVAVAVIVGILVGLKVVSGTAAIILGAIAVIFILTSFIGFCPLYFPFKISTRRKTADNQK